MSHDDTDHSDISFARADTPTRISGVVQKLGEHKAARLEFRGRGENRDDHDESPDGVPQNRDAINCFQETGLIAVVQGYTLVRLGHA